MRAEDLVTSDCGRRAAIRPSDGIILGGLSPRFVLPGVDGWLGINHGVSPAALRDALTALREDHGERPKGVYLISPSYFGAVTDVAALAQIARIVDAPPTPRWRLCPSCADRPDADVSVFRPIGRKTDTSDVRLIRADRPCHNRPVRV